jgi:hypothetical protein
MKAAQPRWTAAIIRIEVRLFHFPVLFLTRLPALSGPARKRKRKR